MASDNVLLDLDTLVERKSVRIDGKLYDLLNPGELTILDLHRFGAQGTEFQRMSTAGAAVEMTDDQVKAISECLVSMVRMILRAPAEVLDRLTDIHRFRIVQTFNALTLLQQPAENVSVAVPAGLPDPVALVPQEPTPDQTGEKS